MKKKKSEYPKYLGLSVPNEKDATIYGEIEKVDLEKNDVANAKLREMFSGNNVWDDGSR